MERVFNFLSSIKAKSVAIFSHIRPDGDALGSQTGLADILLHSGYQVNLYNQSDEYPQNFSFLAYFDRIQQFNDESPLPDVCISVDTATFERIGNIPERIQSLPWINIDHHMTENPHGDLKIVDKNAAATCAILSTMALESGISLTADAATSFFTGISTDTGSFRFQNATSETFVLAGRLLEFGANKDYVQFNVYESTNKKQIEIYKYLYANVRYFQNEEAAYCIFPNDFFTDYDIKSSDMDGAVNLIKNIEGIEVAVLFTEYIQNQIKISVRSKQRFDANKCCHEFGGGGHVRASGAMLKMPIEDAVNEVLSAIERLWE